jgi:hypothetical protein
MYGQPFGFAPAPYAASWTPAAPRTVGELLEVAPQHAVLPHVCAKCGSREGLGGHWENFVWTPPHAYLALLLGVLPGYLVMKSMQKRAVVIVPMCQPCVRRWHSASRLWSFSWLVPFVILFGGWTAQVFLAPDSAGLLFGISWIPFLLTIALLPLSAKLLLVRKHTLWAAHIDERRVQIRGVGPALLAAVGPG